MSQILSLWTGSVPGVEDIPDYEEVPDDGASQQPPERAAPLTLQDFAELGRALSSLSGDQMSLRTLLLASQRTLQNMEDSAQATTNLIFILLALQSGLFISAGVAVCLLVYNL